MNRLLAALLIALQVGLAQGTIPTLDLLANRMADADLCGMPIETVQEQLGIASRILEEDELEMIEYAHLGLSLSFDNGSMVGVTVYAQQIDGMVAFGLHFLGTVAKGTRRVAVERLLRSDAIDYTPSGETELLVELEHGELVIAFDENGIIRLATLTCGDSS